MKFQTAPFFFLRFYAILVLWIMVILLGIALTIAFGVEMHWQYDGQEHTFKWEGATTK